MKSLFHIKVFLFTVLLMAVAINAWGALTVGNYELVQAKRISRTVYEYTYKAQITNAGAGVTNVTAQATSNSPYTSVEEGSLSFGEVGAGASVGSIDTFVIQHNRRYPMDWSSLDWEVQSSPAAVIVTGKAVAGIPVVGTINLKDSSDPPNTSFSAIDIDGNYILEVDPRWQPPFLMWAEGWVNNQHLRLLSTFDLQGGESEVNVNTTPATSAIVESAMEKTAAEMDPLSETVPQTDRVVQIQAHVEQALENLFAVIGLPPDFNLFASVIGDVGSPSDQIYDALTFDTDDSDNVVIADANDANLQVIVDPDGPPVEAPPDMVEAVADTSDALTKIRTVMNGYFAMYQGSRPDENRLNAELRPNLAPGFLEYGYDADDFIAHLAGNSNAGPTNELFIGCSILRPMTTQIYGNTPVEENHDGHPGGKWVNVTSSVGGVSMTWITAFAKMPDGAWKWYGNRIPFRRTARGRPWAKQTIFPSGALYYQSGLLLWHNDLGNLAMNMGITNLAIFNSAFAPEVVDGVNTNCVKLERREHGLDTRFRLTNVPHFWSNDTLYRTGVPRGLDLEALKAQESKELVVIGVDDNDIPQRTWLYTIAEAPDTLDELTANADHYFATVDRDSISFEPFDPDNPGNPDAFPGEAGLFSWTSPDNLELFPSFSILGWNDEHWNWNEYQIDNPVWYSPGDLYAWSSDTYQPGSNATHIREASFNIYFRHANAKHYQTNRRYNPWADEFISIENGEVVFDVAHAYAEENLSSQMQSLIRNRDTNPHRFEAQVVVDSASAIGNAFVETDLKIGYQPDEDRTDGDKNFIGVYARIRYQNGELFLMGFVWGSNNADGSDDFTVPPSSGDYPFRMALNFNQPYTLATEYIQATNQLMVEFDDGQGPYRAYFDMNPYPVFDPANFTNAHIRTRVRSIIDPGDSAAMRARFDDVHVDNTLYDDFNDGFAVSKWEVNTNE